MFLVKGNRIYLVNANNAEGIENYLVEKLGKDYPKLLDFNFISLGNKSLVCTKSFNGLGLSLSDLSKDYTDQEVILNEAVTFMKDFKYSKFQNIPSKLLGTGEGNCQAMSLVLNAILEKSGLDSEIEIEGDHSRNIVRIGEKNYIIDMAKEEIEIKEVE